MKDAVAMARRITDRDLCGLQKAIAAWLKRRAQQHNVGQSK